MKLVTLVVAAVLIACSGAFACYSGLAMIPTADMVEQGQYSIELQFDGDTGGGNEVRILNTQAGITSRFEAGIDCDFTDGTAFMLNAKYIAVTAKDRRPAVAVGICNFGDEMNANLYAVATGDVGDLRGHMGLIGTEGNCRPFVGLDKDVNEQVTLMADYTSGSENSSSVGFNCQFNDRVGIMAGIIFPNAGGDAGYTVHLVFADYFRK